MGTNLQLVHTAPEATDEPRHTRKPAMARFDMPEITLSAIHHAGKLAATKLTAILQRQDFGDMPVETQLRVINAALDRAYGTNIRTIVEEDKETPKQITSAAAALRTLHGKIKHPEMVRANRED